MPSGNNGWIKVITVIGSIAVMLAATLAFQWRIFESRLQSHETNATHDQAVHRETFNAVMRHVEDRISRVDSAVNLRLDDLKDRLDAKE